ncbi:MAG: hypothetical protein A3K03_06600 [Bdellovibrionales bacterium RIFOXYD1_FULL_44_7]|nr:MAG: hypothetical protein A3K03_06600 [Bdellovibrionales bacterium RIFOXYD1_FULL_44_7]
MARKRVLRDFQKSCSDYYPGSKPGVSAPQVHALSTFKIQYRTGVVHTTDYRIREFDEKFKAQLYQERALAIEMESATLFVAGFASKAPIGAFTDTLLRMVNYGV